VSEPPSAAGVGQEPPVTGGTSPDLLDEVQRLIAALESHHDPAVRADVTALLRSIDAIHRTALTRLVDAIRGMAGDAFVNRLAADPAIRLLLMAYDLLAVDRRLLAEEALDAVRGHLHGHGIDVELTEVVGGAVYVRVHGLERGGVPAGAVRHDLEEALRAGLTGFQELVLGDRRAGGPPLLQVAGLKHPRQPVYRRACALGDVGPGAMTAVHVDDQAILVASVEGEIHAVANHCGDTPLPLQFGTLRGAELTCSWHGCRYDVRTGRRLDRAGESLAVFPVSVEGDEVRIAVGTATAVRS
jgi:nitrite reductase/ring-hydroxylating ferredoxin subunit